MVDDKTNNGNFTKLELIDIVNKLRTKYAMKLYEYLQSFGGYKYIDITHKHMLKLLGLNENHKNTKLRKIKNLIKEIKELLKKPDLKEVKFT